APITYSRAQPMSDDGEPNNKALRSIVEGWAKVSPRTSYYFYAWFLAELSGPNPMIAKWSHDVPYGYKKGNCRFWQPETTTDIEKQRIEMASESLSLFDDFMKLREDLAAGRFVGLDQRSKAYVARLLKLGAKYEKQYAFGHGLGWANERNVNCSYYNAFYKA